jgi:hypothetical protein
MVYDIVVIRRIPGGFALRSVPIRARDYDDARKIVRRRKLKAVRIRPRP